jgi:PIN domain nuclease of toxin-antitoxin system
VIYLDTHAWLWLATDPSRLSRAATTAIQSAVGSGGIAIASITLVELAWLMGRGRLRLHGSPERLVTELVETTGVVIREITPVIAALFVQLPENFGRDPVDRIIAATAHAEGAPLVTRDRRLRASRLIETVW